MDSEAILRELRNLSEKVEKLTEAQQVANDLAMSTNPNLPEEIRNEALQKIVQRYSLNQSEAAKQFDEALPSNLIK